MNNSNDDNGNDDNGDERIEEKQDNYNKPPTIDSMPTPKLDSSKSAFISLGSNDTVYKNTSSEADVEIRRLKDLLSKHEEKTQTLKSELADSRSATAKVKEEAKRRIANARTKAEKIEKDAESQVKAMREEGEALAVKQRAMEVAVRRANSERKEYEELVAKLEKENESLSDRNESLSSDLKSAQNSIANMSEEEKLIKQTKIDKSRQEKELVKANATISSLTSTVATLEKDLSDLKEKAEAESTESSAQLRNETTNITKSLGAKLEKQEAEAAIREDSLRKEIEEIRGRWKDAVRRADNLTVDMKNSTLPLLKQVEALERARSEITINSAATERKLRQECDGLSGEKIALERKLGDLSSNVKNLKMKIEVEGEKCKRLETSMQKLNDELKRSSSEKIELEDKISSQERELSITIQNNKSEINKLKKKMEISLLEAGDKRSEEIDSLGETVRELKKENLLLISKIDEFEEEEKGREAGVDSRENEDKNRAQPPDPTAVQLQNSGGAGPTPSFAVISQMKQKLAQSQETITFQKKQIDALNAEKDTILQELVEVKSAHDKLSRLEGEIKTVRKREREYELEVEGLTGDLKDVKNMYQQQINDLIEEKLTRERGGDEENRKTDSNEAAAVPKTPSMESDDQNTVFQTPKERRDNMYNFADYSSGIVD